MVNEECGRLGIKASEYRFTRKTIRDYSGWSDFQVRTHLNRLVDLEYVLIRGGNRGSRLIYELLYQGEGQDGRPFLMGLIDIEKLRKDLGQ